MALTNAERQARFRERREKERMRRISPEDVVEAARIYYEAVHRAWPVANAPDFESWRAEQAKKAGGGSWRDFVPDDPDPASYAGIAPDHAEFLANVGAVMAAARLPGG